MAGKVQPKMLTMDQLRKKTVRTKDVDIELDGEVFTWKLKAISGSSLDALQNRFPPTKEQRNRGFAYNMDKFAPALLSACSVEPSLTVEEANEIWSSEDWSTGELNTLFNSCTDLCMGGDLVNPTASA